MKTSIVSLNDETIRFVLSGVDTAFANTMRRTMVSEVPIMTIEDIFYFDNSSLVPDEILAHRLGLTPLTTDLDTYILPEECDCEAELGCPKCRAVLTMDVEAGDDAVTVYSGDLIPDDPNTAPASKGIPLAKLAPGQSIRFEAYAQLGQGKTHVKWSPVSMCVYQNVSLVPIENKSKTEECVSNCGDAAVIDGKNLKIIDIIDTSTAVLIANKNALNDEWKREKIKDLKVLLMGVIEASKKLHIFMNVKEENLNKILTKLPALKRPTISKLANDESNGWCAINTIIKKEDFLNLIPILRKYAQGLVVHEPRQILPFEKI